MGEEVSVDHEQLLRGQQGHLGSGYGTSGQVRLWSGITSIAWYHAYKGGHMRVFRGVLMSASCDDDPVTRGSILDCLRTVPDTVPLDWMFHRRLPRRVASTMRARCCIYDADEHAVIYSLWKGSWGVRMVRDTKSLDRLRWWVGVSYTHRS